MGKISFKGNEPQIAIKFGSPKCRRKEKFSRVEVGSKNWCKPFVRTGWSQPINGGIIDESGSKSRNLFSNFENVLSGQKRTLSNIELGSGIGMDRISNGRLLYPEMEMS